MKCPHCGSEDLQYATKTKAVAFRFGMQPLGDLCWDRLGP